MKSIQIDSTCGIDGQKAEFCKFGSVRPTGAGTKKSSRRIAGEKRNKREESERERAGLAAPAIEWLCQINNDLWGRCSPELGSGYGSIAATTHSVEASSLITDTGSALPRHRARCNRKPGNGTSIRGYFGATSALRFERVSPSA
ncbi:hypothetical protein ALC62_14195 [Cyphomyrmex costatus]|uniref:Uncharacterized protein n=1 Tax=Cyphomyrmex costatus TaxID=456900 RepID=A0A195C344_9HYME|nr:hypothetical protein ALC62_14195 [Cyphomyrmex costatus]